MPWLRRVVVISPISRLPVLSLIWPTQLVPLLPHPNLLQRRLQAIYSRRRSAGGRSRARAHPHQQPATSAVVLRWSCSTPLEHGAVEVVPPAGGPGGFAQNQTCSPDQRWPRIPASTVRFNLQRGHANVLALQQAKAQLSHQIHFAGFIHQAAQSGDLFTGVRADRTVRFHAPDPWRAFEFHVDPLGSILEQPLPLRIALIVASHEIQQLFMSELRSLMGRKVSGCLCRLVADEPASARVQPQPAVAVGHVRPFDHGLFHDIVHAPILHCAAHSVCGTMHLRPRPGTFALGGRAPMPTMKRLLALLVAMLALSGCGYNDFQRLDEQSKAAWSEVLNQYQRRADLIPNIVNTVKGEANFEQETLTKVIEARAKATSIQVSPETLNDPASFARF